jgi:hypothetical protein
MAGLTDKANHAMHSTRFTHLHRISAGVYGMPRTGIVSLCTGTEYLRDSDSSLASTRGVAKNQLMAKPDPARQI